MIKNYLTQLKQEFHHYSGADCAKDLMAGLTVAAVALPLALAFGVSSGSTAAAGLVTAIIAGLVIGALSGGFYQISCLLYTSSNGFIPVTVSFTSTHISDPFPCSFLILTGVKHGKACQRAPVIYISSIICRWQWISCKAFCTFKCRNVASIRTEIMSKHSTYSGIKIS